MWSKVKNSRKFRTLITAIIGLIVVDVAGLSLSPEMIASIVGLVMSYIVGQGIADAGSGGSQ